MERILILRVEPGYCWVSRIRSVCFCRNFRYTTLSDSLSGQDFLLLVRASIQVAIRYYLALTWFAVSQPILKCKLLGTVRVRNCQAMANIGTKNELEIMEKFFRK